MIDYIGKKLDGRYEIIELIGAGGMANVYKARDLRENRIVAVKILREEFLDNEELVRRFKNESKAIGLLSHPNIVKVFDVNFSDSVQFIVMEYIDGITLKDYIERKKPLSWKDTVHFTVQILRALQHAHDRGIVHRDIKPQNIMLLQDGSIKVMDFGIARFSRSETRTITDKTIGSVHYISPEQAKGDITDAKADLYSVGIMMYEMLTGKLPFDSDSAVSIAIKQISDNAKRPRDIVPEIPEALEEITLKAMAKNPNVRYQSASQMLRDIDDFKKNPSIVFAYKYFSDDNSPTKYIDKSAAPQKKKKGEKGPKKKGSLSIALLLGVTAACVISTVALLLFAFGLLENEKIDVELPNFVGKTLVEIQSDAAYKTFKFTVVEDYNLADVGVVYDQSPLPPKQIKESGAITLFVSKGVEIVAVPDVVGMSSGDGKVALRNLGLVVRQESVSDENYETNKIVQVSPIAGSEIETGGEVTIYVNTLTMSSDTIVPKFIDMMLYDANTTLASYGLQIGVVTMQDNEKPAGTVIGQSIPEGSKVASNTSIDLVVSKGITSRAFSVTASGLPTKVEDGAAYQVYAVFGGATVAGPVAATPGGAFKVDFTATSDGKLDIYVKGKSDYLFQSFTINLVSGSVSAPTGGGSSYGNTVPATISVAPTAVSVAAGATTQLTAT
ncbi:MAG: Stk1 family PASTA domain-containing Ser/Thr kinase, partial [Oscillospiraceae bacterium]